MSADSAITRAFEKVQPDRIAQLTLDLISIKGYTGETVEVAEFYADFLRRLGLEVELLRDLPRTPVVVARLRGVSGGPTLELNGHLDTVPLPHDPPRIENGVVHGRGSADMRGGLAAEVEAVRALVDAGIRLKGDIMLTAHGMHEAPTGHAEDLIHRLHHGPKGDAAVIAEGASNMLLVAGLGMGIFEVEITRAGEAAHENSTPANTPHPILAGTRLVQLMQERHAEYQQMPIPHLGPESFFVAEFHSGDFYNRFPNYAKIVGTRRWAPHKSFEEVGAEIEGLARQVEAETGVAVKVNFSKTKDGFILEPDEPIAAALKGGYHDATGNDLPDGGWRSVADAPVFFKEGGIPAVYHSPGGSGAHADHESVEIASLARAARVYLATAVRFCGITE